MKKEKEIDITHELTITNLEFYKATYDNFIIISKYSLINKLSIEKWNNTKMIKVFGTRVLYGYYVKDRGFYDVTNDHFYSQEYLNSNEYKVEEKKYCLIKKLVK